MFNLAYMIGGLAMLVLGTVLIASLSLASLWGAAFALVGTFFFLLGVASQMKGVK
jgi:hypothetical protein